MKPAPVLPVTKAEMNALGWDKCDIILVTGDAYVDHPSFGAALIGRYLESLGYRVGIVPQPDVDGIEDVTALGRPGLFVGITSGAMDSMVNHYTSLGRIRSNDAYSPGGVSGKRPDRALLKYVNLVQRAMPGIPIVIGGIEASLRRISHYDFWSDRVRKSILLDTKASVLVYGMGEMAIERVAAAFAGGQEPSGIRGTALYLGERAFSEMGLEDYIELPSHEEVASDPAAFMEMTRTVERESNPLNAHTLVQRADSRVLVLYPPAFPLDSHQMDRLYELPFSRRPHPSYSLEIPAYEMIKDSVTVVRGCAGGCSFCALGLHQGRLISSRSHDSVVREVERISDGEEFGGTVTDLGGPTANLYGLGCMGGSRLENCRRVSCLYPEICTNFVTDHGSYLELLERVSSIPGVSRVLISSGIRYDVALRDPEFIRRLAAAHVPGYLKIAPESLSGRVLELMRKPSPDLWRQFLEIFNRASESALKQQFVSPYLLVAFPGCGTQDMLITARELEREGMRPEKAQIFLPTPMTMATAMYHTGLEPVTGKPIAVVRKPSGKRKQLGILPGHSARPGRPKKR